MQNTSSIPNIPNTLINNFFIAGVNQQTLSARILENKAYKIPPEVLFTMYESKERVSDYLQFVFPEKVAVEYNAQDPKFYSFMMTDSKGFNEFFHVLIFYEEINEAEISANDFDNVAEMLRKQHLSRQLTTKNKSINKNNANIRESSSGQLEKLEAGEGALAKQHRNRIQQMFQSRKFTHKKLCASDLKFLRGSVDVPNDDDDHPSTPRRNNVDKLIKESKRRAEERRKHELETKEKMEKMMQNIQLHGGQVTSDPYQSLNQTQSTINMQISQTDPAKILNSINKTNIRPKEGGVRPAGITMSSQTGQSVSYVVKKSSQDLKRPPMMKRQTSNNLKQRDDDNGAHTPNLGGEEVLQLDDSVTFSGVARLAYLHRPTLDKKQKRAFDDSYGANQRYRQTAVAEITHHEEPVFSTSQNKRFLDEIEFDVGLAYEEPFNPNIPFNKQISGGFAEFHEQFSEDEQLRQYQNKRYVPVALCLTTETEFHDIYRQMLLSLFDMIRIPENLIQNKVYDNRTLAFAELISHLAFLRTIPAPPFNTTYNLHCMNQVFTFKEQGYDQIPNRNQHAIKILFDVLDVKSIFYCWKALLFDKWLILVSSQYSLQFYVAEALRQLLFPMTWQNSYIQPGNENLVDKCDGIMVMLYGSNSMVNGFDYFDSMQHPDKVICDIDAGYTNNIAQYNNGVDLPTIPDEAMYIRILNMLKNSRINQYDKAYPDSHLPETDDFVSQVRETFFGLLKPFLSKIEDFMDKTVSPSTTFFHQYFKQKEYLEYFENYGKQHHDFAKALIQSSQFVHFCDDYFQDVDFNNYKMLQEIFKARGELHYTAQAEKAKKEKECDWRKSGFFCNLNLRDTNKCKTGLCTWPDTEPVVFNIRIPQDHQRIMLFEKLLYMNEDSMRKKEKDLSRKTNEHIVQNKDNLMYDKFIQNIKTLYPIKLKETHKKYQMHDMKITQVAQKKFMANQLSTIEHASQRQQQSKIPYLSNVVGSKMMPSMNNQRGFMPRKRTSSESINIVEYDGARSSFIDQKINMKFNQSNVLNNLQHTPTQLRPNNEQQYEGGINRQLTKNLVSNMSNQLQIQLPMDMVNSQDDIYLTSSILQHSNMNNSLIEQEQLRIQANKFRISRLMYGKQGLIAFLQHLFGLLNEKQMHKVNYYFALKGQVENLMEHQKKLARSIKDKRQNKPILEENEDEKSPVGIRKYSYNAPSNQDNTMKTPLSQSSIDQQQLHLKITSKSSALNLGSTMSSKFKSDREWLTIEQWETQACVLKRTYQYIHFKVKMYESFECPEDAYSLIWHDLIKFPTNKMKFFPVSKLQQIWDNLTQTQQQEQFTKLGQKLDRPCIQMICKYYMKQRNTMARTTCMETNGSVSTAFSTFKSVKSDETLFYGATLGKTYVQKKQEKKFRESNLNNSTHKSVRIIENSPFSHASQSDSFLKQEAKIQKRIDKNQKSINDFIKHKLTLKLTRQSQSKQEFSESKFKLKIPPQSAKAQPTEQFTFKGSEVEPMTPKLDKHRSEKSFKSFSQVSSGNNTSSKKQQVQIAVDFDMRNNVKHKSLQITEMKEPQTLVRTMLQAIMKFWRKTSKHVQSNGSFNETELDWILQEMRKFEQCLKIMKTTEPVFQEKDDIGKQVFFLNLFNFIVLYHLSVLMISNPEAVKKLTSYNMWQSFLTSATIKIGLQKISAHTIKHSILRPSLPLPQISTFMLNVATLEPHFQRYRVNKPSRLIAFGFYLPLNKMPQLKIFNIKDFETELRVSAQQYLIDRIKIRDNTLLISLPKFIYWYQNDYHGWDLESILQYIEKDVFQSGSMFKIKDLLEKIQSKVVNPLDYIIEYSCFNWQFKPRKMKEFFPDHRQSSYPFND